MYILIVFYLQCEFEWNLLNSLKWCERFMAANSDIVEILLTPNYDKWTTALVTPWMYLSISKAPFCYDRKLRCVISLEMCERQLVFTLEQSFQC